MYPHDVNKMRNEQLVWHLTQTNLKMLGSSGFFTIMPDWYLFNASGKCVPGTGGSDIKPVSEGHCLCSRPPANIYNFYRTFSCIPMMSYFVMLKDKPKEEK